MVIVPQYTALGADPSMLATTLLANDMGGYPLARPLVIDPDAGLLAIGRWKIPDKMTAGFLVFGKGLIAVISIGLAIATFEFMTETAIMPEGWELASPMDGIEIVGFIGMMLLGAFPAVYVIIKAAEKPLCAAGRLVGMNDLAAGGMVVTLAHSIPMFRILEDIDPRGKVLNCAFAVSASFIFGARLGFAAAGEHSMISPMIVGKLVAGASAVGVA